jgi:hypothetical protein
MGDAAITASAYLGLTELIEVPAEPTNMGMRPVTIALDGDTASYLVLALKEELASGKLRSTTARVYNDVIDAVVAAIDPPAPELRLVDAEDSSTE